MTRKITEQNTPIYKLDGVGPFDNRPPPLASFTTLSEKKKKNDFSIKLDGVGPVDNRPSTD